MKIPLWNMLRSRKQLTAEFREREKADLAVLQRWGAGWES
jgi:hypothetical protein